MKVIILGAGLIGVSSAYFLRKSGHEVTVIDRQSGSGLETSYANGGQISVCYSEPWSSFSNLKKMIHWMGKEDSPILFRPHLNQHQMGWGMKFLHECLPSRNQQNIRDMLKLALFSRETLQDLRKEENLTYNEQTNGILTFYTSKDGFEHGIESAKFMSKFGCNRLIKNVEETLDIEPALKNSTLPVYGSDYSPEDESGDALIYTQKMTDICQKMGVEFLFDHDIVELTPNNKGDINSVVLKNRLTQYTYSMSGDSFVIALGAYSYPIAKKIGINLPIYPAKGYSATVTITEPELVNKVSLTDMDSKTVYTRIGNELRIAGTAEFNGFDLTLNQGRCDALINRVRKILPHGLDYDNATFWTGLRPATPGNVPIIERTKKYSNLYINAGHGTLGWTMASGSGKLLAKIIDKDSNFLMNWNRDR